MTFMPSSVEHIILSLVQGEEGTAWASKRNGWNPETDQPICSWEGVNCDPTDGSVVSIDVSGSDLRAKIPSELGQLKSLRELNLGKCDLYGPIPPELASSLPLLESFNIKENGIDGTIPHFSSTNLKHLVMQQNRLHGPLPDPPPPNLVVLDVSHNHISGTIPWSYEKLHSLEFFDVGFNELEGSLPYHIGDLQELKGFFVNNNKLLGTIPFSFSRNDSKLVQIFLEYNNLSGTVPAGIADIPPLKDLFVDGNKFTGTVPKSLCKLNLNEDFFKDKFNVSGRDGCTSISCPVNTVSEEGVYPCHECPRQGFSPYLGHNKRCFYLDERMILDTFWEKTDGPNWFGGAGWNILNAEKCSFDGIVCNNAGKVVNITLPGMNLRGTIPEELGYLTQLQHLNLSNNELTGFLPSDLRWAPLESLDVSGNRLEGFVPPMLCLTGDINGNGENGDFNCDVIACSAGTWSPIGRATHKTSRFIEEEQRYECQPCPGGAEHLGTKICPVVNVVVGTLTQPLVVDGALIVGLVISAIFLCCSSGIIGARVSSLVSRNSAGKTSRQISYDNTTQKHGSIGRGGSSSGDGGGGGASSNDDDEEELWFLNIPKEDINDVKKKSKRKGKSKSKRKKKQPDDEEGEEELYFVDVPSVV